MPTITSRQTGVNIRKSMRAVEDWNAKVTEGVTKVVYTRDLKEPRNTTVTVTRAEASVLPSGMAVVWLEGVTGCVALANVKVE